MLSLKEKYNKDAAPAMMKNFGYKNAMAVPKIEKVAINSGFGKMVSGKTSDEQKKMQAAIIEDLSAICGQRPVLSQAKKSIAGFKLRQGTPVGACVTLRGQKMYDFLDKLINVALPRSHDFQGINPKSFDKSGNMTVAIREHTVFPEIAIEKTKFIFGLEITIVLKTKNQQEGLDFLKTMGFPISSR